MCVENVTGVASYFDGVNTWFHKTVINPLISNLGPTTQYRAHRGL